MNKEDRLAKYRDPRWQKMRLEILSRDEFVCQSCFDKDSTLHVHHRWYLAEKEPWEYPPQALITLCESCHEDESNRLNDSTRKLIQDLKIVGAMASDFDELAFFLGCNEIRGAPDTWSVLAFGFREVIQRYCSRDEEHAKLSDRYYAWLREVRKMLAEDAQRAALSKQSDHPAV